MRLARRAWCRAYQTTFRIALPVLPYFEPPVADTVEKVPELLAKHGVTTALLVTDPGVARLGLTHGLEDALAAVRGGVELADVQIGGLGGGAGTTTAFGIAFRPSDVDAMKALDQEGVHVHVHVVPAQQDVELPDLINKLGF